MKKLLIIVLAAVLALGGGAAAVVAIISNQPENVVANSIFGAITDLTKREEIAPLVNMLEKGSLEVSASVDADKVGLNIFGGEDIKAGGKLYFSEDEYMLKNLNVTYGDTSVSGDVYIGEDLMYVSNKDILGGSWGIIRGEMEKSFKKSELIEYFGLDDDTVKNISTILKDYDNGKDKDLKKDLEKYIEEYMKVAMKALAEYAEYKSETDNVKVGGEKVSARVIEVTIDGKAMSKILKDISKELDGDDKLRDLVDDYLAPYKSMLKDEGVIEKSTKEIYDDFVDEIKDLAGECKDLDGELIITVVTPKMSSTLMKLSVAFKEGKDKDVIFSLDLGEKGIKKTDKISLEMDDGNDTVEYTIKDNDSKKYNAQLGVKYDGEKKATPICKISVDKQKDTFKLEIGEDSETVLSGKLESKSKTTTITLNKIKAGDIEIKKGFEVKLVICEKDKMPKPASKVNNIFKLTEEKLDEMEERAEEVLSGSFGFGASPMPDEEAAKPEEVYPEYTWPEYDYGEPEEEYPKYTLPEYGYDDPAYSVEPDYGENNPNYGYATEVTPESEYDPDEPVFETIIAIVTIPFESFPDSPIVIAPSSGISGGIVFNPSISIESIWDGAESVIIEESK